MKIVFVFRNSEVILLSQNFIKFIKIEEIFYSYYEIIIGISVWQNISIIDWEERKHLTYDMLNFNKFLYHEVKLEILDLNFYKLL